MVADLSREAFCIRVVESQGVEREVIGPQFQGGPQSGLPTRDRLTRHVVQQVEVDGAEAGRTSRRHGRGHVLWGVAPAEAAQLARVHALGAKRDAVDTRGRERREIAPLVGAGVRFEGHLRVGRETIAAADGRHEPLQPLPGDKGRRPAAEVEAAERWPRPAEPRVEGVGPQLQFPANCLV